MIISLLIIFIILIGYLFISFNKKIILLEKNFTRKVELRVTEIKLYLLDEIDNKIIEIKDLQTLEFQKHSKETKVYIDKLQQQLISNEFIKLRTDISKDLTKLKTDVSKDLDNIVESVKNIKVF